MERMVKLVSMVNHEVILNDNNYGVKKVFPKKDSFQMIPFDTLQSVIWGNTGASNMLNNGTLYIENMQDKIDLGLEAEGTTQPTNIRVLTDPQILTLLKVKSVPDFIKEINGLSMMQLNGIIDYAVTNKIIDTEKSNILQKLTGKDIVALVARENENKLIDEKIARKEAMDKQFGVQ